MKGITLEFKNRPNEDGSVSTLEIEDCLVAQTGSPATKRPRLTIHLPKTNVDTVAGAWLDYDGSTYHVVGVSAAGIAENVPTRWNRYAIAEKIY